MLATDQTTEAQSLLEQWDANERMRHIPDAAWMAAKLDGDIRQRIEKLWVPFSDIGSSDPRHSAIETEFRSICRWLDRIAEIARRSRGGAHPPTDLGHRLRWALGQAFSNVSALEAATFGKRFPYQTHERSSAEPLWAAMLSVITHLQRLVPLIRDIEPDIDERLYEDLVRLEEPLRREPIA